MVLPLVTYSPSLSCNNAGGPATGSVTIVMGSVAADSAVLTSRTPPSWRVHTRGAATEEPSTPSDRAATSPSFSKCARQRPSTQVPWQREPHAKQFCGSLRRSVSQPLAACPSQSPKPDSHLK